MQEVVGNFQHSAELWACRMKHGEIVRILMTLGTQTKWAATVCRDTWELQLPLQQDLPPAALEVPSPATLGGPAAAEASAAAAALPSAAALEAAAPAVASAATAAGVPAPFKAAPVMKPAAVKMPRAAATDADAPAVASPAPAAVTREPAPSAGDFSAAAPAVGCSDHAAMGPWCRSEVTQQWHPGMCHFTSSPYEGVFIGDLPPTLEPGDLKLRLKDEVGTVQDFRMGSGGFAMQHMKYAMVTFVEEGAMKRALEKIPKWTWKRQEGPMAGVLHHCSCRPLQDRRPRMF
jgi:hypothetical protein